MAKKATEPDFLIYSPQYRGLKSKMTQADKDKMKSENPKGYSLLTGETEFIPEKQVETDEQETVI